MSGLRRMRARAWAFFAKRALDAELEAELETHLQLAIDDYVEHGMDAAEARRQALIQFGGVQQAREKHREARGLMQVDILLQDLKYTIRKLRRDPGFTAIAVLILALGIGANVAVFSVVNTILLRPLPFPHAQELVWIAPPPSKCGQSCATYSSDAYDEFRALSRSYQDVTGYFAFSGPDNRRLTGNGEPVTLTEVDVIGNFFKVLGVKPQLGRMFTPEEARGAAMGEARAVLLSNAWWRRQFNGDPGVVGKTIDLNGSQATIVGVLPDSFDFGAVFSPGSRVDVFAPLNLEEARTWGNIVTFIGRLQPGVTVSQARAEAALVAPKLYQNAKRPDTLGVYKDGMVPIPLKQHVSGTLRRPLMVLWSAVGMILLIACVNLSNLLLARATARSKEFAMRGALGAGRWRIVQQLLTESVVLSGAGAALGLLLAVLVIAWLRRQEAIALPLLSQLHLDAAALSWTVLIAAASAALFGLLPGLRMVGGNLHEALKDTGAGAGQSRKHERLRSALVVSEVALACILLVGAGLLLRSFLRVIDIDLGFAPARAAAVVVDYNDDVPGDKDGSLSAEKRREIFQQILSRVSELPGVNAAGTSDYLPLGANREWGMPIPQGRDPNDFKDIDGPLVYVISPDFFRAMGMRLRGRDFTWDDGPKSEPVVIISASMARFLWPHQDAVGKILIHAGPSDHARVIGVVDDIHDNGVETAAGWQIYYSMAQANPAGARLVVRTTLPPSALASSVLHALRELNPRQPIAAFVPIQSLVDHANSPRRFFMMLVVSFAVLGLLLAALGIYGVISYAVTRRTQEIGVRMALGANATQVQQQVLAGTLRLALWGIAIGVAASMGTARLMAALLYDTSPWDAATYFGMAAALLVVAAVAGYVPALRASRISPLVALRTE